MIDKGFFRLDIIMASWKQSDKGFPSVALFFFVYGWWSKDIIYNVEFDPGSGWTLATGLTHASRGAAWI